MKQNVIIVLLILLLTALGTVSGWLTHEAQLLNAENERLARQTESNYIKRNYIIPGIMHYMPFVKRLEKFMDETDGNGKLCAMVSIDGDNMGKLSQKVGGQNVGILVDSIQKIAVECFDTMGENFACSLGKNSDEIYIVIPDCPSKEAVAERTQKFVDRIRNTVFQRNGITVGSTVSAGITFRNDSYNTAQTFFNAADDALYTAKQTGKNRYYMK